MAESGTPPLPKKEHDLFKSTVKFYETKNYKKGVKAADAVLKNFPLHGETLAMKGLLLNCMDKKEEAHECVKKGLALDVKSHVCWHVYGLVHRSERNYTMAIKCYLNALRIDPQNKQILRDISLLQVQMRDLPGFMETRRKILVSQPSNRANWVNYALAQHLCGRHQRALGILESFLGAQQKVQVGVVEEKEKTPTERYEESELLLYQAQILEEQGKLAEALELLEAKKASIVDHVSREGAAGRLELRLGRHAEARARFLALLRANPDNYEWHRGLQCAALRLAGPALDAALAQAALALPSGGPGLGADARATLAEEYAALAAEGLGGHAVRRVPLDFLEGEGRRAALRAYLARGLRKGVPGLGADLAALIGGREVLREPLAVAESPAHALLAELTEEAVAGLEATGRFPWEEAGPPAAGGEGEGAAAAAAAEPATCVLWAKYLRCQWLELAGRYEEALGVLEECLAHTPTGVDLYLRRARLLKKSGDPGAAADAADAARRLDLSDRYLNNKCTKYLLRAGRVAEAEGCIALFTRHDGDPQYTLFEMQASWYELEWARAAAAAGRAGPALKKYAAVEKHFQDFQEDQFDFHTYCTRKCTLRAYLGALRWEDRVCDSRFFEAAARGAVELYLALADRPAEDGDREPTAEEYAAMAPAARKKAKQKARKAAQKRQREAEEAQARREAAAAEAKAAAEAAAKAAAAAGAGGEPAAAKKASARPLRAAPKDEDPDGAALAARAPLPECVRYVEALRRQAPRRPLTHLLAFDVALRRGRALQAAAALRCLARAGGAGHPGLAPRLVRLMAALAAPAAEAAGGLLAGKGAAVRAVLAAEVAALAEGRDAAGVAAAAATAAAAGPGSLDGWLGAAAARAALGGGGEEGAAAAEAQALALRAFERPGCRGMGAGALAAAAPRVARELGAAAGAAFRARAAERFPRHPAFQEETAAVY